MKKPLYLWVLIAVGLMALTGCEKKKLPVPEEIEIPASSEEVFSVGISFDSGFTDISELHHLVMVTFSSITGENVISFSNRFSKM